MYIYIYYNIIHIYLYITKLLGPGAFGTYANTLRRTGHFWTPGACFPWPQFLSLPPRALKSDFGRFRPSQSAPNELQIGAWNHVNRQHVEKARSVKSHSIYHVLEGLGLPN